MASDRTKRYVIGISGASGALYAQRVVSALVSLQHEVHLVASPNGVRLLHDELGHEGLNLHALAGIPETDEPKSRGIHLHAYRDVGAPIASGTFQHDGMAIVPCSASTLNAIAAGLGDNLLHRAAGVTLKERRRLVLCHRETPLTLMDVEAMRTLTLAGATVLPANPGFYFLPKTVEDIVDFVAARVLDAMGCEHEIAPRWNGPGAASSQRR